MDLLQLIEKSEQRFPEPDDLQSTTRRDLSPEVIFQRSTLTPRILKWSGSCHVGRSEVGVF